MSKKSVLESMRVRKPCSADWEEMTGNDLVRSCTHCSKNVNDVSKMTRKDAIRLVRRSNGSLCIRYIMDPKTKKPTFAENLIQISRRAPRLALGVMSASLSLATLSYAQTQPPLPEVPVAERINKQPGTSATAINDDVGKTDTDGANDVAHNGPPDQIIIAGEIAVRMEYSGLLAQAVARDDANAVRDLISRGEDVNSREDDRTTPLFIAVENGNLEIAGMLLNFGAKVNARNSGRETPLMKLDEDASKELVELLVRWGAKLDMTDSMGNTPLILAAGNSRSEVVQALLDAGAAIDANNTEGTTALISAAYADDIENVRILLLAGADVNLKNDADETAYDKTSDKEIEELLVSHGAIPKDKSEYADQIDN